MEVQWNDCTLHAVKSLHSIAGNICKYCSNLQYNFYYFSTAIFTSFRCNFYFFFAAIFINFPMPFLLPFRCRKYLLSHCLLRKTRIFQKFILIFQKVAKLAELQRIDSPFPCSKERKFVYFSNQFCQ